MSLRRPLLAALAGVALLTTACGASRLQYSSDESTESNSPAAAAPSSAMPGMAMPASTPSTPSDMSPQLPPAAAVIGQRNAATHELTVNLTVERKDIEIAPGVTYHAWTFGGSVPGPVIRATAGDTVHIHVTNKDTTGMGHSIDFHAAQVAPDKDYNEIPAGTTKSFDFVAAHPGVFMYHCGSPMIIQHMANGMYGAIIVDPKGGRPAAREYVLVQSEFYTAADAQQQMRDETNGTAQYVVFNGYQNHYKLQPLVANPGESIRLYVVDAGPNHWSAFHVVGALFSSVQASGNPVNQQQWVQTATVAPGDGAVFELTIPDAGTYPVVTHSFGDVGLGAVGAIKVAANSPTEPLLP